MEEKWLNPEFDYWSFDYDHLKKEPRSLSAWKYTGDHTFDDDLRVKLHSEPHQYIFTPPTQFPASTPHSYQSFEKAYKEAVRYVQNFDVERLGETQL